MTAYESPSLLVRVSSHFRWVNKVVQVPSTAPCKISSPEPRGHPAAEHPRLLAAAEAAYVSLGPSVEAYCCKERIYFGYLSQMLQSSSLGTSSPRVDEVMSFDPDGTQHGSYDGMHIPESLMPHEIASLLFQPCVLIPGCATRRPVSAGCSQKLGTGAGGCIQHTAASINI